MDSLKQALERIVKDQDFSLAAAAALESEIAKQHPEDERLEDLEHILASYRPGGGEFLFDEKELERECIRALKLL
jgi:hypothetical protein